MAKKFKFIKKKVFTHNGIDHANYTCSYKGRAVNINTLAFSDEEEGVIKEVTEGDDITHITIDCKVEAIKEQYTDLDGLVREGIKIMPAFDL